jgi:ketosteroid isomerase-like protein
MVLLAASPLAAAGDLRHGPAQVVSPGLERANPEMQARPDASRREVQLRVEEFLTKLGNRDVEGVRAMFAPKALVTVLRQQANGTFTNTQQTGDEFMAQFAKGAGQPKFREPISNVHVSVEDGHLAFLRATFEVIRDGRVMSTGVDYFTLVREPDGWKIAAIAYTSLPGSPAS